MSKIKGLVVDDAMFMRDMIKEIFNDERYEVVGEAANGEEAIEKHEALEPDVTTMDLIMPFKNGLEATKAIIERDPDAVVIVCSALGEEAMAVEAIDAGAADYIVKPFTPEDVLDVVEKALKSREV